MAAAEEEEKEDGVKVVEGKGLIFILEVGNVFLNVGEQENDGTQLPTTVSLLSGMELNKLSLLSTYKSS